MSEHTPGPWHMQLTDHRRIRSAHENEAVCWVYSGNKFRADSAVLADANLIAAAPDLLAACKEAMFLAAHGVCAVNTSSDPGCKANAERNIAECIRIQDIIRAAIAKAEGGAA